MQQQPSTPHLSIEEWPDGLAAWLDYVAATSPGIAEADAFTLGYALLGSAATPRWESKPEQFRVGRLGLECGLAVLVLQAWKDRADQARLTPGMGGAALREEGVAATVCDSLFRHTPRVLPDEDQP